MGVEAKFGDAMNVGKYARLARSINLDILIIIGMDEFRIFPGDDGFRMYFLPWWVV